MRNLILGIITVVGCLKLIDDFFFYDPTPVVQRDEAWHQQELDREKGRVVVPTVNPDDGPAIDPNSVRIAVPPPITEGDDGSIEKHVYGPTTYETPDGRTIQCYPTGPSGQQAFTHEVGFFERHYRIGEFVGLMAILSFGASGIAISTLTIGAGGGLLSSSTTTIPTGVFALPAGATLIALFIWYVPVHMFMKDSAEMAKVMGMFVDFGIDFFWRLVTGKFF